MFADNNEIVNDLESFFNVLNNISDFVFIMKVDEEGHFRYLFVNEPAVKFTGFKEESLGKTINEVMPKHIAELISKQYQNAIQKKICITYEDYKLSSSQFIKYPHNLTDNYDDSVHFESKVTPLFNDMGSCTHIIAIVRDITDRKRKEIELKALKDRYHSLYEYNFNGVYSVDLQGYFTSLNPSAEKITGYSAEELIGKHITTFIVPDYLELTRDSFQKASKGEAQKFESAIYHKEGHVVFLTVMNVPILIDGQILGVYGIVIDQTENKKAEKALKDSEERYRRLVEMSPEGIVVHRDGKVIFANPSALKSMKEKDPIGQSIFSYIHPDYHEISKERIWDGNIGVKIPYIEMKMIRKNGETIFADVGGMSILYDGKPAVMTLFRDVTERKLIEHALKESEEKYRLIANNMTDLVSIIDTNGIMKYASPSHEFVLGHSPQVYEGKLAFAYIHPDEIEYIQNQFMNIVLKKQTETVEFRHKLANGDWMWVEAKASPFLDDKGDTLHVLVVAREITERKSFEKKLSYMAYHDTLTGLPNRRLFIEKLEQALKEADQIGRKTAVMYMDIDKFKHINDTFGHDVGDELLIQFSQRVKGYIRKSDTLVRLGGDEFCVLLEISQEKDAKDVAQKIIDGLQNKWKIGNHEFVTTSSIGIAIYNDGFNSETLLKAADIALYRAKEKGRNNYQMYN